MWRAAKNLLPTAENLWQKKILQQPWCQRCGKQGENTVHAILNCKVAQKTWKSTAFAGDMKLFANQDILSILQILAARKSGAEMESFVLLCWAIWHSRNLFVFEGKREDSQSISGQSRGNPIVDSYRKIKPPPLPSSSKQKSSENQAWKPVPVGWFKVNVDAATKVENQVAGLGAVIRDSEGNFVAEAQKQDKLYGDALAAEAKANQLGIDMAESAGCMPLIIESDCQEAVDLVMGKKDGRTEIGWIISDIHEGQRRLNITVQHISRLCNDAAHSIAKMALNNSETVMWTNPCPPHLLHLFQS